MINHSETEQEALSLIRREKTAWEQAAVWVSTDSYYYMRDEIDKARKNYYGKFEEEKDSETGLEKLWVPLTEWLVERLVANIDLDTKDIHIKHPEGRDVRIPLTLKMIVVNFLKKIGFGEFLNDFLRRLCIDGIGIVKCFNKYSEEYKRNLPTLRIVDPLNFIIDPAAYSLQGVPVIEKIEMTIDEIERYRGQWKRINDIVYKESSVPTATIYERWGKIRKSWITGNASDYNKWIEGVIICSEGEVERKTSVGTEMDTIMIVHKIMANPDNIKPYEECWLRRVPGRWHGRGIPEQVRGLQTWINTVVNIRREELLNKLAGKYKIRKGSGITRQMLESIRAGGAIPVDNMDDIQELRESDVKPSAYREPLDAIQMAEQVSGAKEIPTSPTMEPTTAVLQERGVRSITNLIQENVGLFLERLFKRHLIPLIIKDLKNGEVLRITGDPEDLEIIDETYENYVLNSKNLTPLEKVKLRRKIREQLEKWGNDRPLKVLKSVFDVDYDVEVYVTAERFDPAIILRNLNDFLLSYGRLPQADIDIINSVVREYLNTLEIPLSRKIKNIGRLRQPIAQAPQGEIQLKVPRKEVPTPQAELERARLEGVLSPAEK